MKTKVEEMAERVRLALCTRGSLSVAGLAVELGGASMNDLGMAIGWLARGSEVNFERRGGALWVALSPEAVSTGATRRDLEPAGI